MLYKLNVRESSRADYRKIKEEIISTYFNLFVRLYCYIRFLIIPLRLMDSIVQFIPRSGLVLDLGCGFGLFTLFYAKLYPNTQFLGIDISSKRISVAQQSAQKLSLSNVTFKVGDALESSIELEARFQAVISIDLLHHIDFEKGDQLAKLIHNKLLAEKGVWIIKDVSTQPRFMLLFTYFLDFLMSPDDDFYYRNSFIWRELCLSLGFKRVHIFDVWDVLPYPHFILTAEKN